jgi:DNA-binding transcriptional regulator YhcF (GntR family)
VTAADRPTPFRRASIPDQVAAALRESIRDGSVGDPLPGEHELAVRYGVSRSSLRSALQQLEAENLLVRNNGRRARVNPTRPAPPPAQPTVCVVCPSSRETVALHKHPILMEMRARCANRGIRWEEVFDARLAGSRPGPQLRRITVGRRGICWILLACGAPIQRWFASSGAPTLVLGSCAPGVELPSNDVDFRAIGWHAAGRIIGLGHRRITILQPLRPLPGDLAAQEGFLAYAQRASVRVNVSALPADGSRMLWGTRIRALMRSPSAPTAVFTTRVTHALGVIYHGFSVGRRIPGDLSVVLGKSDLMLETALPEVARYRDVHLRQAALAMRVVEAMLTGHLIARKPTQLVPAFIPGSTLGPAPVS